MNELLRIPFLDKARSSARASAETGDRAQEPSLLSWEIPEGGLEKDMER